MPQWDPQQYAKYAGERGRPFADLVARVGATDPSYVVDLGCGPGTLTRTLVGRWPGALVHGVDSSAEMVAEANGRAGGGLTFQQADLADWEPPRPVDVLVSNAALQWAPGHLGLFERFAGWLTGRGWFAFQVPANWDAPSHVTLRALAAEPPYAEHTAPVRGRVEMVPVVDYVDRLSGLGFTVDAWVTTYQHILTGPDGVLEWIKGTGARPTLQALPDGLRATFEAELGRRLHAVYPERGFGTLFPFERCFVVAQRGRADPA